MMATMADASNASPSIVVTPAAVAFAAKKLCARQTPDAMIRLGVKGGGCSGFAYAISFEDDAPRETDTAIIVGGVTFIVDAKSIVHLRGSTLDYDGRLTSMGLTFSNPHEASRCGCGHSFSVRPI